MRFPVPVLSLALVLLSACGNDKPSTDTKVGVPSASTPAGPPAVGATSTAAAAPAGSRYQLATEPAGAIPVIAARAKGEAKEVVVVGRLKDTVPGFAAFTLTDASLAYCGQGALEDPCPTPWDYCCHAPDDVAAATISVGVRAKGEVVEAAVPELRNMDLVVVHGVLVKAADGSVRLDADGWFRKERPVAAASVVFPK